MLRSKKRVISLGSTFIILIGAIYYLITGNFVRQQPLGTDEAVVVSITDGDTIKVRYEGRVESVRLIGIDAPEIDQEEWGIRAQKRLSELVPPGEVVRLEFDVIRRDRYGRLLSYVFTRDGRFVNEVMVREGLALLYTFPPNVKYTEILKKAQSYARENMLGIWGRDGLSMTPQEFRRTRKKY